jgi:hypothetical protein
MALGILNRSVERKGDPTIVVTYPQGDSRVGSQDVPNQQIAFDIGNKRALGLRARRPLRGLGRGDPAPPTSRRSGGSPTSRPRSSSRS